MFASEGASGSERQKYGAISKFGVSRGIPPGKFFFNNENAANWAIFIIFVRPLGGAMAPLAPPPWSHLWG